MFVLWGAGVGGCPQQVKEKFPEESHGRIMDRCLQDLHVKLFGAMFEDMLHS